MTFFTELEKNYLKLHMEPKESPHSQVNSKLKEHKGGITLPTFKLHYKAIVIKTALYWFQTDISTNGTKQRQRRQHKVSKTIQYLRKLTKTSNGERIPCLVNGVV